MSEGPAAADVHGEGPLPPRRDAGLLGGAPRSRRTHPLYNHAWLFAENKIYRLDGFDASGEELLEPYEILRPDTSQREVYWCRHLHSGHERNLILDPRMQRVPTAVLRLRGEWQFWPDSHVT